jgi:hypothetical protein
VNDLFCTANGRIRRYSGFATNLAGADGTQKSRLLTATLWAGASCFIARHCLSKFLRTQRKENKMTLIIIIVLVLLLGGGGGYYGYGRWGYGGGAGIGLGTILLILLIAYLLGAL